MANITDWSELPLDLLESIANHLDIDTDFKHFRAVCRSWRSSTSATPMLTKFPLLLPFPFRPRLHLPLPLLTNSSTKPISNPSFKLIERIVYFIQKPQIPENACLILKIEKQEKGNLRLVNPVTNTYCPVNLLSENLLPNVLDTLEYRISKICKSYVLKEIDPGEFDPNPRYAFRWARKVAVSPSIDIQETFVMAIDGCEALWQIKFGDEEWKPVFRGFSGFKDVLYHKGEFYAIHVDGLTYAFDISVKATITNVTGAMSHRASRHLVDLRGELCLVEEVANENKKVCMCSDMEDSCYCCMGRTLVKKANVDIVIYKIDKLAKKWILADKMDKTHDQFIFVGDDIALLPQDIKNFHMTRASYSDTCIVLSG